MGSYNQKHFRTHPYYARMTQSIVQDEDGYREVIQWNRSDRFARLFVRGIPGEYTRSQPYPRGFRLVYYDFPLDLHVTALVGVHWIYRAIHGGRSRCSVWWWTFRAHLIARQVQARYEKRRQAIMDLPEQRRCDVCVNRRVTVDNQAPLGSGRYWPEETEDCASEYVTEAMWDNPKICPFFTPQKRCPKHPDEYDWPGEGCVVCFEISQAVDEEGRRRGIVL